MHVPLAVRWFCCWVVLVRWWFAGGSLVIRWWFRGGSWVILGWFVAVGDGNGCVRERASATRLPVEPDGLVLQLWSGHQTGPCNVDLNLVGDLAGQAVLTGISSKPQKDNVD